MTPLEYMDIDWDNIRPGANPVGVRTLVLAVFNCTAYKFKRKGSKTWQYEVVVPGYGKPPKMDKWEDITIIN